MLVTLQTQRKLYGITRDIYKKKQIQQNAHPIAPRGRPPCRHSDHIAEHITVPSFVSCQLFHLASTLNDCVVESTVII